MSLASAADHELRSPQMPHATPIVFVVDDDISVRESLEALIRCEGWQPETFASAQEFLSRPRVLAPSILDVALPDLNGLDLQKRVALDRMDMPIILRNSEHSFFASCTRHLPTKQEVTLRSRQVRTSAGRAWD
jgi:PleD family two-component response regulator